MGKYQKIIDAIISHEEIEICLKEKETCINLCVNLVEKYMTQNKGVHFPIRIESKKSDFLGKNKDKFTGYIFLFENKGALIYYTDELENSIEINACISHEIGHTVLHYDTIDIHGEIKENEHEEQANEFGAEFLENRFNHYSTIPELNCESYNQNEEEYKEAFELCYFQHD